jgi:dethiobiotin synthetase
MTAIFITATGTDIGKTFVAAGLIRHWRAAGRKVEALKPVVTGFDPFATTASDPGLLLAALGRPVTETEIERIAPWRFAAPLSPDMAARRERRTIHFDALVDFSRNAIAANNGALLIEGIGGIMVPLDDTHTVLDWITALQIPAVVVTGTYLGSLSHTLTTLDVLARHRIAVKSLVVNETAGSSVGMQDTAATLANFSSPIPLLTVSRRADDADPIFAKMARLLET